jgi:hypothetical protein
MSEPTAACTSGCSEHLTGSHHSRKEPLLCCLTSLYWTRVSSNGESQGVTLKLRRGVTTTTSVLSITSFKGYSGVGTIWNKTAGSYSRTR